MFDKAEISVLAAEIQFLAHAKMLQKAIRSAIKSDFYIPAEVVLQKLLIIRGSYLPQLSPPQN